MALMASSVKGPVFSRATFSNTCFSRPGMYTCVSSLERERERERERKGERERVSSEGGGNGRQAGRRDYESGLRAFLDLPILMETSALRLRSCTSDWSIPSISWRRLDRSFGVSGSIFCLEEWGRGGGAV